MSQLPGHPVASTWPEAFSPAFVADALAFLRRHKALVIVGPPSSDRRLLAEAVVAAAGQTARTHRSQLSDKSTPFFCLGQLVPSLVVRPGQRTEAVVEAGREILRHQPAGAHLVLLHDADLCDDESITALGSLVGTGDLQLIATLTSETADVASLLGATGAVVELAPLDSDAIRHLLRSRFGSPAHPIVVRLLERRSQGTYAVLRQAADSSFAAGLLTVVEDVLIADPRGIAPSVALAGRGFSPRSAARLGGSEAITDLVDLTAVVGEITDAEAAQCFSTSDLDVALTHGTIRHVGGAFVVTSHAEALLIDSQMSDARRSRLFSSYAHRLPESMLRPGAALWAAQWWASQDQAMPSTLAAAAATQANLRGEHEWAVRVTDPSANDSSATVAPIERGYALRELGRLEELGSLLRSTDPSTLTDDELTFHLLWGWGTAHGGEGPETALPPARDPVVALARLVRQIPGSGRDTVLRELRTLLLSGVLSPTNRAMAHVGESIFLRQVGQPQLAVRSAQAALDILAELPDSASAVTLAPAHEVQIRALLDSLDLDAAEQLLQEYSSDSVQLGRSTQIGAALWAALEYRRGDMAQAAANLRVCLGTLADHDPQDLRGWAEANLAMALTHLGRDDEARALLAQSEAHPSITWRQHELERRVAVAVTLDLLGEPEDALDVVEGAIASATIDGLLLARIEAAALAVQISGPDRLPTLNDAIAHLDQPGGVPAVWRTFARACGDLDIDELARLAVRLDDSRNRRMAADVAHCALDLAMVKDSTMSAYSRECLRRISALDITGFGAEDR